MKILLVHPGKLSTVPMSAFVANALMQLGHEVIDFDLSSGIFDKLKDRLYFMKNEFHGSLNRRFRAVVEALKPDLMLTIFGFDLSSESLELLRRNGIPRVCWWLNDPFQFQRSLNKADYYDYIFTNSIGSIADYKKAGIKNAFWLPTACDPDVHKRMPPVAAYRSEICFAGDWSQLREEWCTELAKNFDVRVFGPWKKKLKQSSLLWNRVSDGFFTPTQMAEMFSSAKIVFNLHSWYGKWDHGTNPRLFEAAGCGACQVVDWKQDIPALFDVDREMVIFNTADELNVKVNELLSDDAWRDALSINAQQRALSEHTYLHRMETLIRIVGHGV